MNKQTILSNAQCEQAVKAAPNAIIRNMDYIAASANSLHLTEKQGKQYLRILLLAAAAKIAERDFISKKN